MKSNTSARELARKEAADAKRRRAEAIATNEKMLRDAFSGDIIATSYCDYVLIDASLTHAMLWQVGTRRVRRVKISLHSLARNYGSLRLRRFR